MNETSQLGVRLRNCRERLGLKRVELAKRIDASPEALRRIEMGWTKSPGVYLTDRLAKELGVSALYLLHGENHQQPVENRHGIIFTRVTETLWEVKLPFDHALPEREREYLARRLAFELDLLRENFSSTATDPKTT